MVKMGYSVDDSWSGKPRKQAKATW